MTLESSYTGHCTAPGVCCFSSHSLEQQTNLGIDSQYGAGDLNLIFLARGSCSGRGPAGVPIILTGADDESSAIFEDIFPSSMYLRKSSDILRNPPSVLFLCCSSANSWFLHIRILLMGI